MTGKRFLYLCSYQ